MSNPLLKLVPFVCLVALGCADSQDLGSGGGPGTCEPGECEPETGGGTGGGKDAGGRVGTGSPQEGSSADAGSNAAAGAGGGDPSSGEGGALSEPAPVCEACCQQPHVIGTDQLIVRVDDSNSFGAPFLVDALLPTWDGVAPLPVRTHEFLNVFAPAVARAAVGEAEEEFVFDAGASPIASPEGDQLLALQVALRHVESVQVPARAVTLVVDTSPSVGASVDRLLGAIDLVVGQLRAEDALGVYSWASDASRRALRPLATLDEQPLDPEALRDAVQREIDLTDGAADLGVALREALTKAQASPGGGNVLLVSDGSSGVDQATLDAVTAAAAASVRVVGIGVGPAEGYSDAVLDAITDASGGASIYFDGSDAAAALLESRFREMVDIARGGVRLRLSLPASVSLIVTSAGDTGEVGSSTIAGQNLAVGGTMTFHETLRWTGTAADDPCAAIGWEVLDGADLVLASDSIAIGDIFAGVTKSTAFVEGAAVVAAASALKGPTAARLGRAIEAMHLAAKAVEDDGVAWSGHRLEALCVSLATVCERREVDCPACPGVEQLPE